MNIKEEIVKEIEKLNKEYLYEKNGTIYCRDEESYHAEFDDIIIKFLKKSNYRKIAKLYEEAKKFFWYA